MASRPPRSVPTTRKHLLYLLTLDLIRLQADSLFEGLEKVVFGSVVNLYLFIVVGRLQCNGEEPVVGHFPGDRGRLSLVATADDLDASSQSRKVSRVGRGTVQTSSQMITQGIHFCPILSGVQSV